MKAYPGSKEMKRTITPELIQQMIVSVLPWSPGGVKITAQEYRDIVNTLTNIVAGVMVAGLTGILIGSITGRFSSETMFEVKEIAGIPVPVPGRIFTDTGSQIESLTDRELWLELMEAFEEARKRTNMRYLKGNKVCT